MSVLSLFWAVLLVSLSFRQTPGSLVDVFLTGGIVLVYIVRWRFIRSFRMRAPTRTVYLWGLLLFLMAVTAMVSHDRSASILAWFRMLDGFLVLLLFSTEQETKRTQIYSTFKYGGLLSIVSFLFLYAYKAVFGLPWVNGLIAQTGHHPASYALVSLFPFLLGITPVVPILISLVVIAILIGSRSALVLCAAGLFFFVRTFKDRTVRYMMIPCALMLIVGIIAITVLRAQPFTTRLAMISRYPILAVLTKEPSSDALRASYARQSIAAIRQFPLTGYGPGTFEYLSRRYETASGQFSAYAHSYPLQFAAENGSIATLVFLILMGTVVLDAIRILRKPDPARTPYAISVLLMTIYGCIDVPLNYLPYWLLYWAAAGTMMSQLPRRTVSVGPFVMGIGIVILSWIVSSFFLMARMPQNALWSAPYRKDAALSVLATSSPLSLRDSDLLFSFLYAKDPDIQMGRAKVYENNIDLYIQTLNIDQYNYSYWTAALAATRASNPTRLPQLLCTLFRLHERAFSCTGVDTPAFTDYLLSEEFSRALSVFSGNDGAAKFFYYLGLTYHDYSGETGLPLSLWELAKNTAPQWGFYHLELASGTFYWHNDRAGAEQILSACMNNPISRTGCAVVRNNPTMLMPPGSLRLDIEALPRLLP